MPWLRQLKALWSALSVGPVLAAVGWLVTFFASHPFTLALGPFGLAVVVVAIVVRVLLLTLLPYQLAVGERARSVAAANEAAVGPELARLRKRLAKDPRALARATLDLYRSHGINPAAQSLVALRSSLLPLALQLPIVVAVYTVIRMYASTASSVHDLHFLWIPSLAGSDPLFVLPVLAGVTTFVLARLSAKAAAARSGATSSLQVGGAFSAVYPVAMAVTAQFVPAALAVYWVAGNVAAIIQQHLVNLRVS